MLTLFVLEESALVTVFVPFPLMERPAAVWPLLYALCALLHTMAPLVLPARRYT